MKKFTFLFLLFAAASIYSCNTENLDDNSQINEIPNFSVTENTTNFQLRKANAEDPCVTKTLIAGQNMEAGTVTVNMDDENIIITYSTNPDSDWTIDLTHLSLGDCSDQWVPTTGSGNPKVGKFEHTEPHSVGTNEVIYQISLDLLDTDADGYYCFAAHAEVSSVSGGGETAWAEDFVDPEETIRRTYDGNNWAMYAKANLSDCDLDAPPVQK